VDGVFGFQKYASAASHADESAVAGEHHESGEHEAAYSQHDHAIFDHRAAHLNFARGFDVDGYARHNGRLEGGAGGHGAAADHDRQYVDFGAEEGLYMHSADVHKTAYGHAYVVPAAISAYTYAQSDMYACTKDKQKGHERAYVNANLPANLDAWGSPVTPECWDGCVPMDVPELRL
jgi:hypothetical protein